MGSPTCTSSGHSTSESFTALQATVKILLVILLAGTCAAADAGAGEAALKPVDLQQADFDTAVQALPAGRGVLMEFYASWCPACKHFQPHYEKVSAFFYGSPRPKPEVYVARVDCATEAALCSRFSVGHYPTLRFGKPTDFVVGKEGQLEEYNGVRAEKEIIEWVGKLLSTAYDYNPDKGGEASQQEAPGVQVSTTDAPKVPQHADSSDIESSTILAFRYIADIGSGLDGLEKRQALKDWIDLLAASHPLDRCRAGAQAAQEALPKLWPPNQAAGPGQAFNQIAICGETASPKEWGSCKGSRGNSRGFTCGLWLLLHSLAAHATPEATGGAFWMTSVRQYVQQFFKCSECSQHFEAMAAEEAAAAVTSRHDAVLWSWRAHNIVNKRVAKQEQADHSGDPFFPKVQWPTPEMCPLCRVPTLAAQAADADHPEWNEDEVYRFLLNFYGKSAKREDAASLFGNRKALRTKVKGDGAGRSFLQVGALILIVLAAAVVVLRLRSAQGRKNGYAVL
ncbi:g3875 [Coccomyxa elongata]